MGFLINARSATKRTFERIAYQKLSITENTTLEEQNFLIELSWRQCKPKHGGMKMHEETGVTALFHALLKMGCLFQHLANYVVN